MLVYYRWGFDGILRGGRDGRKGGEYTVGVVLLDSEVAYSSDAGDLVFEDVVGLSAVEDLEDGGDCCLAGSWDERTTGWNGGDQSQESEKKGECELHRR